MIFQNKNIPRNFGKYPLLEIINFLNINEQIAMLNFNKRLRDKILNYHKCKVLNAFLIKWKKIKIEAEFNLNVKLSICPNFFIFAILIKILEDASSDIVESSIDEKIQISNFLFLKCINYFQIISESVINLKEIKFSDKTAKIISNFFNHINFYDIIENLTPKHLLTLDLSNNKIGPNECKFLSDILKSNSMQNINLSDNNIGPSGSLILAEILKTNYSLKTLDLSRVKLGQEGCKYLADILINKISTLRSINLSGNYIGPEGCKILSKILITNSSLRSINLQSNHIGPNGCRYLAELLMNNSSLNTIILSDNYIGINGSKYLASILVTNSSTTKLDLADNNIGHIIVTF